MISFVSNTSNLYNANLDSKSIKSSSLNTNSASNFLKDKSEAVSEILGYGVDNEGFFTSDFNEAAGLPKDYKIYAKDIEDLLSSIKFGSSAKDVFFTEINLEKSLNNAYKVFSQLSDTTNFFRYNINSFKIDKIYKDEAEFMSQNNELFKVNAKFDFKEGESKGKALMSFVNSMNGNYGLFEGQTTIIAKMGGLDRSMSINEIKDLNDFLEKHPITQGFNDEITRKILLLPMQMQDIEDFKKEWLELKALNDELLKSKNENLQETNLNQKDLNLQENSNSKEKPKEKPFAPIQAESKSQTFTYDDIRKNFFLSFLENERKKGNDMLELLQSLFKVDKVDLRT